MSSKEAEIKWWAGCRARLRGIFLQVSGGKTIVVLQRVGIVAGGGLLLLAVVMAWFGPAEDKTFYMQTTQAQNRGENGANSHGAAVSKPVAALFTNGEKKKEADERNALEQRKRRVAIKYFAPQLVGMSSKAPKAIRSGSKLVAFLLKAIDTRSPSAVQVRIAQGGEVNGVEIEKGSVLTGQYSYPGSGNLVFLSFMRLDTPEGEPKKIQAQALGSGTYTAGISGEVHSDAGVKTAASLGLTMFSGMADVLTEKESLGVSQNGVQAKSTMRNALLQGLSRSAQEQTGRMENEITSAKDYVIIPEGKEMIIELTEDFK
ncbi:MAG: TrbI/VirB10 family protein [Nitrosomonas ureae]